jgi:general stress protein 26
LVKTKARARRVPRRVRPKFPEKWHVPNEPDKWIAWDHADSKLAGETVYWISTATRQGKPHSAPVWGIWKNDRLYFETHPSSAKGRNLTANPRLVVHVQDGNDTVIVEGTARREKSAKVLDLLVKEYTRKYGYTPDWSNTRDHIVFKVDPKIVHAWKAPRMHRSLVKFIF